MHHEKQKLKKKQGWKNSKDRGNKTETLNKKKKGSDLGGKRGGRPRITEQVCFVYTRWGEASKKSIISALSAECLKASSLHWQSVQPWFRLPGASEEHRPPLESYSITPKWTDRVEMGHDNKCHRRITPAAGPLQRSSLPQEGCNKGERSQGQPTVSPAELHATYGRVCHHLSIRPLLFQI